MLLLRLFFEFCKIGIIAFGGGNAVFPIIHREIVVNLQLIQEQDLLHMVSIAETTPGSIRMNLSTFIGYKTAGFPGALISTIGYNLLPTLIMVVVFALLMLVVYVIDMGGFHNFRPYLLSLFAFIVFIRFKKMNPIYLLLICGLIGMLCF